VVLRIAIEPCQYPWSAGRNTIGDTSRSVRRCVSCATPTTVRHASPPMMPSDDAPGTRMR
jgi:hypothetical protein